MTSAANVVVIVVDRLGSGWLGPYGNTWVETPSLNQLAAESTLSEFMVSDSHDLAAVYRSYFTGQPAWTNASPVGPTLPQIARDANYETLLVTDGDDVAHHPLAAAFQQVDLLTWKRPPQTAAETHQTRVAEVFRAAGEALSKSAQPKFLWVHAAAMNAAWDAPYELRERLVAENDPAPPQFVLSPALELAKGYDPDELLGIVQAYAAEVTSLDDCLGSFLETVDVVCDPANTLLIFTSPRGYALGEHLRVGRPGDALRGEILQVPWLVRMPGKAGRLMRSSSLHQPVDLFETVAAQLRGQAAEETGPETELIVAQAPDEWALRTEHWFFRQSGDGDAHRAELYAKPDDRWEVNEVSARAADVVAAFEELADWLRANRDLPNRPNLPALPEVLTAARR